MSALSTMARIGIGIALAVSLLYARPSGQSGRGLMHGYVDFEGMSWNDLPASKVKAKIELQPAAGNSRSAYTTETNEHGIYDIKPVSMGEYTLKITCPGYKTYQADLLIPSDFECRLATALKKAKG